MLHKSVLLSPTTTSRNSITAVTAETTETKSPVTSMLLIH